MEKAILIKTMATDGLGAIVQVTAVPFTANEEGLGFYYRHLDCECIDIVPAYGLIVPEIEGGICLVVDDEALLKENPIVNSIGSLAYGYMEHGQPICGTVMVCKDKYTEDGTETVGFTDEELSKVHRNISKLVMKFNER